MELTKQQTELCLRLREDLDVTDVDAIAAADLIELLAAHSAGAQEPVGTAVNDEELGRFWEMHKPASEFPVGTHVYAQPQPMPLTDAARDAKRYRWLREQPYWPEENAIDNGDDLDARIDAEIERLNRDNQGQSYD